MRIKDASVSSPLFTAEQPPQSCTVTLQFEDEWISVPAGITVAAALLLSGAGHFRTTPVSSSPRAPYCMMGVCFECLVEVDGKPSRQACLTTVRDGMVVRRQQGASELPMITEEEQNGK
jgi:predicted molibdopterin-dependent oxidoreductase YjgC